MEAALTDDPDPESIDVTAPRPLAIISFANCSAAMATARTVLNSATGYFRLSGKAK
jgi:hypothetical protein